MTELRLLKLVGDTELGLILDPVSTPRFALEMYEYSARKLAMLAEGEFLRLAEATVFEHTADGFYEQFVHSVDIMADGDYVEELCELFNSVCQSLYRYRHRPENATDGYAIIPYGSGSSFGIEGPTLAWFFIHQNAPAIIVRQMDEYVADHISRWFAHWLYNGQRTTWPVPNRINKALEVPAISNMQVSFPDIRRQSRLGFRKRRKSAINLQVR